MLGNQFSQNYQSNLTCYQTNPLSIIINLPYSNNPSQPNSFVSQNQMDSTGFSFNNPSVNFTFGAYYPLSTYSFPYQVNLNNTYISNGYQPNQSTLNIQTFQSQDYSTNYNSNINYIQKENLIYITPEFLQINKPIGEYKYEMQEKTQKMGNIIPQMEEMKCIGNFSRPPKYLEVLQYSENPEYLEPLLYLDLKETYPVKKDKLIAVHNNIRVQQGYDLLREVSKGSFGTVYEAIHKQTQIKRAFKMIPRQESGIISSNLIQLEFNALKSLDHPNIIKLYEAYFTNDSAYFVSEFLEGGTLASKLKLSINEGLIALWIKDMLKAINYCHKRKIGHKDLKLENVMFDSKGNLKIIDFGISSIIKEKQVFKSVSYGTPLYLPPEYHKKNEYNYKCDIWSIGIIVMFLLTQKPPFSSNKSVLSSQIAQANFDYSYFSKPEFSFLSNEVIDFMVACLNNNPENRPEAFQLLEMDFIQKCRFQFPEKPINLELKEQILTRFIEFHTKPSIIRFILNYFFSNGLIKANEKFPEDIVRNMFGYFDINNDGVISIKEALYHLGPSLSKFNISVEQFVKIFGKIDIGKDGFIGYTEFYAAMCEQNILEDQALLDVAFNYIDKDGDGFINQNDVGMIYPKNYNFLNMKLKTVFKRIKIKKNKIPKKDLIKWIREIAQAKSQNAYTKPSQSSCNIF